MPGYYRQILPVLSSNLHAFYLSCKVLLLDAHYRTHSIEEGNNLLRRLRTILTICLISSILVWTLGFLLGSSRSFTWALAGLAAFLTPLSAVGLIFMHISGLGAPPQEVRRKAGDTLKCVECGRPSVPGSNFCRYHLDIKKEEEGRE